jgi:predicted nuclease of restriction endonuclease-like (RecB) superfamily
MTNLQPQEDSIYLSIQAILSIAREKAYKAINFAMVEAYWHIGKIIIDAQDGNQRAEYGQSLLKNISKQLTKEFGKGFTVTNLSYIRQFYLTFSNYHALRDNLSWTHYRLLMKVERAEQRQFYMNECVQSNWSTRQLERQINSFFYERILSSQDKDLVRKEIHILEPNITPKDIIKDPFVLEFLNLEDNRNFNELDIEKGLVSNLQEFTISLNVLC